MNEPQCLPREDLKQYLAGWSGPEQSDLIESHLSECEACEQTIVALEADPDTLVEFLGYKKPAQDPTSNSLIQDALAQSRELLGNQTRQDSWAGGEAKEAELRAPGELGAYQLLRPLGQGGMGAVYLAKHSKLGKELAIKILPARRFRNPVFAARFQREIRAAGELEHPAIVRATDAGEEHGTHYLVMEHIDGLDLSQLSRAVGKLNIPDACELIRNAALGLSHAHSQGIIHRDVKPSNLMLSKSGETKILDFGLARIGPWEGESAELTTVGQLMGTLDYMAPEQAERADAVDYRADLYSLGATLFRLLCGRAPLAASPDLSPLAKLRLLATHEPPTLATLRPDAPVELVELVSRLLSRDPARRPASADHVAEELRRFTEGHQLKKLSAEAIELQKKQPKGESESFREPEIASRGAEASNGRNSKVWLSLALVPLLILAGIWITLETQKGLLVIESDAEATVKLLKGGKEYQEVEVKPGPNSTRIYAGKYEVVLAEGSDSLKLTQEQISVTRGGTSIAKLRWDKPAPMGIESTGSSLVESPKDNSSTTPITEPVYRGKTLSTYLNMLSYERSSEGLGEAFVAIEALTTIENAKEVRELLLRLLPTVNGDLEVRPKEDYISSVDYQAFELLKETTSDSEFRDLLLEQLKNASGEWRARLVGQFSRVEYAQIGPCIDWLEKEVVAAGESDELLDAASNQLLVWYVSVEDQPAIQQQVKTLLQTSEAFDRHFWLNQMQFHRHDKKQAVLNLAKPHCLATMEDANESPQSLAQATVMLLELLDADQVSEQDSASLRSSVRARLGEFDDSTLLEMTSLNSNFSYEHTIPSWRIDSRSSRATSQFPNPYAGRGGRGSVSMGTLRFNFSGGQATCLPAKLLDLAAKLELDVEDLAEKWMVKTESAYQKLTPVLGEHRGFIEMNWPTLQLESVQSVSSRSPIFGGIYAKLSGIKPETWIGYFLHVQAKGFLPASEAEETTQSTPPARTRSTTARDTARAASQGRNGNFPEPLYKGRPLQEWMRILPLEKSQVGVEEALAAIQASLTKEARPQLMQMLKRELPTLGWRFAHYRTAFSIMRRADSKEYCKFITEQLETPEGADGPDDRWKNILITCSIAPESKLEEIEPIHRWIVSNGLVENSVWLKTCSEMYRRISSDILATQSLAEAMVQALVNCEPLRENDSFWYGSPHGSPASSTDPSEIWMKVVGDRTMEVWADFDASKERVATVGRFLQRFVGRTYTSEQRNKGLWRKYLAFDQIEEVLLARLKKSLTDGTYLDETAIQLDNWASPRPNDCLIRFNTTAHGNREIHNMHLDMRTLLGLLALHQYEGTADPFKRFSEDLLAKLRGAVAQLCVTVAAREKISLLDSIRQRSAGLGAAEVLRRLTLTWPLHENELDQLGVAREQVLATILYCSIRQGARSHAYAYIENGKLRTECEELLLVEEFSASDTDNSNALDENELSKSRLRLTSDWFSKAPYLLRKGVELDLATLDKDKDGVVTLDEIQSFRASLQAQHEEALERARTFERNRLMEKDPKMRPYLEWAKRTIKKYDLNEDGQLTKSEWDKMIIKPDGADENEDGVITALEYAKHRASTKPSGGDSSSSNANERE